MIRILTDTSSDITREYAKENNIDLVSMKVSFGADEFMDKVNITNEGFYDLLSSRQEFPKTSQPSPQDFLIAFNEAKNNKDELICILVSSALSGTYQSAVLAKSIVDYDKIHIIDTLSAASGIKILIEIAKKMIANGNSAQEIVDELNHIKHYIRIYASVNSLEYLCKGGRVSKAAATIGEMVSLKPVITINKEGKIDVLAKPIGVNKAISLVTKKAQEDIDTNYPTYAIYSSGIKNITKVNEKMHNANIHIDETVQLGPTIGAHVGPEAFGICFVEKH